MIKRIGVFALTAILCMSYDYADMQTQATEASPWLTGPLIAPPGTTTPKGVYNVQLYAYFNTDTGVYDSHWNSHSIPNYFSFSPQVFTLIGLTSWMDIQFTPQAYYNSSQGHDAFNIGDLPIGLGFQLFSADAPTLFPGIKFAIEETFPLGKYQKLNPNKAGTQVTGLGSFSTSFSLILYKLYHVSQHHYLSFTGSVANTLSAPVHVKGFNAYGGGYGTRGKVYPGNNTQIIVSFEYTLNQNWVLAIDNVYTHTNKNRFSGKRGVQANDAPAIVTYPSTEQFSIAPAIEYNFSDAIGIIAGAWVTIAGRNATQFRDAVINIDMTF